MKDAFYFPHFCNARHDRKIKRIRKELGVEGYGIFFMLLEVLRDQTDFRFPTEDIDLLADEFGTSEQKVRTVINNYDLFQIDDNQEFFSTNLIVFLQPYLVTKERNKISGIRGNLIKYKYITKEESNIMTNEDIKQKHTELGTTSGGESGGDRYKGKERKQIKEIKEKKIDYTLTDSVIDYFNKKTGKNMRYMLSSREPIHARLSEGFTVDDCKQVIDIKYTEWISDDEMEKYITVQTFFRQTKFEKYLNQEAGKKKNTLADVYARLEARGLA